MGDRAHAGRGLCYHQGMGFEYKTTFVWYTIKHNMGHYSSVRHELLLVATRGSRLPDNAKLYNSVQSIARSQKHSEKPQQFRDIIDDIYRIGNRIELFARAPHAKWETWGNEVRSVAVVEAAQ
jgi:N6-adenosine-specific RNA methylase IME4